MPVNIFELQSDRRTVKVDKYDLTVTYRPNQMTPARELAILRASAISDDDDDVDELLANGERNVKRQIDAFVELVESWDFMGPLAADGEGQLLPVDPNREDIEGYVASMGGTLLVPAGQVVPLKADYLRIIPSFFLTDVTIAINEDLRPDPKKRRR